MNYKPTFINTKDEWQSFKDNFSDDHTVIKSLELGDCNFDDEVYLTVIGYKEYLIICEAYQVKNNDIFPVRYSVKQITEEFKDNLEVKLRMLEV